MLSGSCLGGIPGGTWMLRPGHKVEDEGAGSGAGRGLRSAKAVFRYGARGTQRVLLGPGTDGWKSCRLCLRGVEAQLPTPRVVFEKSKNTI